MRRLPVQQISVAIGIVAWATCASAADWPQWLGPDRNGSTSETVTAWEQPPEVVWKASLGSGFSSPIVADGVVYVHTSVPDQDVEAVIALDAQTGEQKWRDEYERAPYTSNLGSGPRGTPSVVDGRLYTFGITGVLSCYDCTDGRRVWQTNPYTELKTSTPGFGVCVSPLVVENRLILPLGGEGSAVIALDAQTGKMAWTKFDEPAATASPVLLRRGSGETARTEVVVQTTLRLLGLRPADGEVLWEHPLVFQPQGVSPTPLCVGEVLVCSTQDTGTLALELPTGPEDPAHQKWWNQEQSSYFSTGTIDPTGRVFVISNALMPLPRADLHCLDLATGNEQWTQTGLGYFHVGVIRLGDGKLLLLDDAGNLILGDAGETAFKPLAMAKACDGTFCNPALADGLVYVRDAQQLVCLRLGPSTKDR